MDSSTVYFLVSTDHISLPNYVDLNNKLSAKNAICRLMSSSQ